MDINKVIEALSAHQQIQSQLDNLIEKDDKKEELTKLEEQLLKQKEEYKQKSNDYKKLKEKQFIYDLLQNEQEVDKRSLK